MSGARVLPAALASPGDSAGPGAAKEEAPWAKRHVCGWTGCRVWASPGLRWVRGVGFRDGATSLAFFAMTTNVFRKIFSSFVPSEGGRVRRMIFIIKMALGVLRIRPRVLLSPFKRQC